MAISLCRNSASPVLDASSPVPASEPRSRVHLASCRVVTCPACVKIGATRARAHAHSEGGTRKADASRRRTREPACIATRPSPRRRRFLTNIRHISSTRRPRTYSVADLDKKIICLVLTAVFTRVIALTMYNLYDVFIVLGSEHTTIEVHMPGYE
ncbi:hypothetical protein BV25DRAFT_1335994 [Artomyces pyxidatus]|uniref:Uncharacterized protein n=1 Tax=Artomyces pyxidatus TaxID=48021 RepID=A0ACB8SQ70_9AGAM|nr:hypothetical protein BV25DRAFT_1335994 [Artomyces pyxidatus]